MEKIIVGKWYRHRGNKNSVPERVKNAPKNYLVVARYRDGKFNNVRSRYLSTFVMHADVWEHLKVGSDIMAYKFVEKK